MLFRQASLQAIPLFFVLVAHGCTDGSDEGAGGGLLVPADAAPSVEPAAQAVSAAVEIDLSSVMDRGPVAFHARRGDGSYESASPSFYAKAEGAALTVVPTGWTEAARPEGGLELSTSSIRRGAWSSSTSDAFRADGDGGVARELGVVTEWLRPRETGIEQGWTLASRPPDAGAIEIALDVEGVLSAEPIAGGLRLNTQAGAVLYGDATWFEADGDRILVKPHWQSGRLTLSVPASVVDAASYPVVLDPLIGPENPLDPYAWVPLIRFGGKAVCSSTFCIDSYVGTFDTKSVRFALDGQLIDPQAVAAPMFTNVTARAAAGDDIALVRLGSNGGVELLFIDANTAPIAAPLLLDATGLYAYAGIACSPTECLVAWHTANADVVAQRVALDGSLIDPSPFYLATNPYPVATAVGWNGTNFLVTAGFGYRVAPDGTVLDPLVAGVGSVSRIASDGNDWLVHGNSFHRIVHADGTVGPYLTHSIDADKDVAWAGSVYVMGAGSGYLLFDAAGVQIGAGHSIPALFSGVPFTVDSITGVPGGGVFIVGQSDRGGGLLKLDAAGTSVLGPVTLGHRANDQLQPVLTAGNGQYLLVWDDERVLPNSALMGMRFTPAGVPLDSVPFLVLDDPNGPVAAASNGTFYAVAARVGGGGRALRITQDGVVLDPGGVDLALAASPQVLAMASDGNNFLVESGDTATNGKLFYSNGTVGLAFVGSLLGGKCAATFNGTNYLVATNGGGTLRYRTVTPGGISGPITTTPIGAFDAPSTVCVGPTCMILTSLEALTVPLAPVQLNAPLSIAAPKLAGAGTEFVAVAVDPVPNTNTLKGARFSVTTPPAQLGDWFPIAQLPSGQGFDSAVATLGGNGALVAYGRFDPAVARQRIFLRSLVLASPQGATCTVDADCQSSHCSDGFCCDQACGGSVQGDCQTCAAALGASADGVCTLRASGSVCRAAVGGCDLEEVCSGQTAACPANVLKGAGQICRASVGDCDLAEVCNGSVTACPNDVKNVGFVCRSASDVCDVAETCGAADDFCPPDSVVPMGTSCRASAGPCDVAEACDGANTICPADTFQPVGSVCRASVGECDAVESCSGSSAQCPTDDAVPESTPCGPAPAGSCDAADACEGLIGATAVCSERFAPDGTACGPGGVCLMGACDTGMGGGGSSTGGGSSNGGGSANGGSSSDGGGTTANGGAGGASDGGASGGGAAPPDVSAGVGGSASDDGGGDGCSCRSGREAPTSSAWPAVLLTLLLRRRRASASK